MSFDLRRLFGNKPTPPPSAAQAVAELLLEIARADLSTTASEIGLIRSHLGKAYGLNDPQLDSLMAEAEARVERSVSLHDTVQTVNQRLSAEDKAQLIGALWQVAYADQRLDPHEEALLRRLADLLHVPHSVFIREKLKTLS